MTTFRLEVDWGGAGTFTDETAYVRYVRGWHGFGAEGRIAEPGGLVAILDNSSRRFSPENSEGALYGSLLPGKAIWLLATADSFTWPVWAGWVTDIRPAPGEWGREVVELVAEDGMARLARARVSVVAAESKLASLAIEEVVEAVYTPGVFGAEDNGDVLSKWGTMWKPEEVTAAQVLAEVCKATYGLFYTRPGQYEGGAVLEQADYSPRWEDQKYFGIGEVAHLDLGVVPVLEMGLGMRLDRVITRAEVVAYPRETAGAAAVLWTARTVLRVAPGQTRVVYALFRDENGERCGAVDVVTPVATTDFRVFEFADGGGVEYTNSPRFSLAAEIEGTRAKLTLSNTAVGALYVTFLQVRGKAVRTYDAVNVVKESSGGAAQYGQRVVGVDTLMVSDELYAQAYAEWLVSRFGSAWLAAEWVRLGDGVIDGLYNVFRVAVLDWIRVSEGQSGLSQVPHRVRRVGVEVTVAGGTVEWLLERMDDLRYFRVSAGGGGSEGKLDETTYLGF